MDKIVIVINGTGGVGKDTLANAVYGTYRSKNISSIDPVKEAAKRLGWVEADKGRDARRFLSELKRVSSEFNDFPHQDLMRRTLMFADGTHRILFAHIREPDAIERYVRELRDRGIKCVTLLVTRPGQETNWGNASDDCVADYPYDYIYRNEAPDEESAKTNFIWFIDNKLMEQEGRP